MTTYYPQTVIYEEKKVTFWALLFVLFFIGIVFFLVYFVSEFIGYLIFLPLIGLFFGIFATYNMAFYSVKIFDDNNGSPGSEIYSRVVAGGLVAGWNEKDLSGLIKETSLSYKDLIPENKYKHPPIICIYEGIRDHMTQILFILKENFTDKELGFTGWKSFSKGDLISLCKGEYDIYNDWENGDKFAFQFPEKINYFLESYCDKV